MGFADVSRVILILELKYAKNAQGCAHHAYQNLFAWNVTTIHWYSLLIKHVLAKLGPFLNQQQPIVNCVLISVSPVAILQFA